jgi:hypothetical protein
MYFWRKEARVQEMLDTLLQTADAEKNQRGDAVFRASHDCVSSVNYFETSGPVIAVLKRYALFDSIVNKQSRAV